MVNEMRDWDPMPIQAFPGAFRDKAFRGSGWDGGWRQLPVAVLETPSGGDWHLETGSSEVTVSPGELLVILPNTTHRMRTGESPDMRSSWLIIYWKVNGVPLRLKSGCQVIRSMRASTQLRTIIRLLNRPLSLKTRARAHSNAMGLLAEIAECAILESRRDSRIERALTYIQDHMSEPIACDDLARVAGLSKSRFHEVFKELLGEAPLAYLNQQRIRRAAHMLGQRQITVAEIGEACGFSSPQYFSRFFLLKTGLSPRAYRQHLFEADPVCRSRP